MSKKKKKRRIAKERRKICIKRRLFTGPDYEDHKIMNMTEFISVIILHRVMVLDLYLWMPGYSYDPSFP